MPRKTKVAPTAGTVDAIRESVSATIVPLCAASRQDIPEAEQSPAPVLLSASVLPGDLSSRNSEVYAYGDMTADAVDIVFEPLRKKLKKALRAIERHADVCDQLFLIAACKRWKRDQGEDRCQQGYFMSAIILELGFCDFGEKGRARQQQRAYWAASERLTAAGIPFIDDLK